MVDFYGKFRYSRLFGHPEHQFNFFSHQIGGARSKDHEPSFTSKSEKNGHVLGLEKSFFLSPLHHDVYSCSRASLLPFRVVNHGGLTLY